MAPRREFDDPSSDEEDEEDIDNDAPRSRSARRRSRRHLPDRRGPVRRWTAEEEEDEIEPAPRRRSHLHREQWPVYWRARDSLYFEPLVALAIIVVLLAGLYGYTQNWPPVYVVESSSMQHGPNDVLGVINTGDLVLAQRLPTDQITPYVAGLQTGYSTYGEYGDVILYAPNGQASTPIIHRALLFLQWDPVTASYNATDLAGLKCGNATGAVYATPGTSSSLGTNCAVTDLTGTLDLYHIGWRSVTVSVTLAPSVLGRHSGFLTMGDNNLDPTGCTTNCVAGLPDQVDGLSQLVEPGWVVGVARGMLPWFGAIKLLLEGNTGLVPPQSWQFLGLTVAGLILLAFGIHYALRAEGIEDERRKEEEAEAREASAGSEPPEEGGGRRFLHALRPWGRAEVEEDDEEDAPPRHRRTRSTTRSRRGRPRPKVRRGEKGRRHRSADDDEV